jgi:hypothetical protein
MKFTFTDSLPNLVLCSIKNLSEIVPQNYSLELNRKAICLFFFSIFTMSQLLFAFFMFKKIFVFTKTSCIRIFL